MKKTKTQAFANLIGSLIFIAVGVWALIQTYSFQEVKNTYVQAAVFPQIMCVGMLIFAVILLIQSIIKLMTMDEVLRISQLPNVTITTYGDLLRVPGSVPGDNLQRRSAQGADVRMVYSPMDSLDMAEQEPDREFIFLGVGFETTAPGTAIAVQEAKARGRKNFSLLSLLKRTEPAMRAIIESDDFNVSGFLCPGHVATILGEEGFRFLAEEYGIPSVIAGFETGDILAAVYQLLRQIQTGDPHLENEYTRAVAPQGNPMARQILAGRCVARVGHHPQQRLRPAAGIFRLRCGSEVRLPAGGQGGEDRM